MSSTAARLTLSKQVRLLLSYKSYTSEDKDDKVLADIARRVVPLRQLSLLFWLAAVYTISCTNVYLITCRKLSNSARAVNV